MNKLCAMCAVNTVKGRNTFCQYCYFDNKEFIDGLLKDCKTVRPKWLKFLEANTAKESRRLTREMHMVNNWNE